VKCESGDNPNVTNGLTETIWGREISRRRTEVYYPYTNVMFVNVQWILHEASLRNIFDTVEFSNCICINRWGDLPLWGETLGKLGVEIEVMRDWNYLHRSHGFEISGRDSTC